MTVKMSSRKKILIVGMLDSVHLARWLEIFRDQPLDFILFGTSPNRFVHEKIAVLIQQKVGASYSLHGPSNAFSIPLYLLDKVFSNRLRGLILRSAIAHHNPNVLHALEVQGGGYIATLALDNTSIAPKPRFLVTNYGSDIYWFQQFRSHARRIRGVLTHADAYSAECIRDYELAKKFGFSGEELPLIPNSGGLPKFAMAPFSRERRLTIAVKGYQGKFGRAVTVLSVLYAFRESLGEYTIKVFSAGFATRMYITGLRLRGGLKIMAFKKHTLSHSGMLELLRESEVYIGASTSDGISTSMLEAMSQGAFPIQSSSSCADEWFTPGLSGFTFDYRSKPELITAIRSALFDEGFRLAARQANLDAVQHGYSLEKNNEIARSFYDIA